MGYDPLAIASLLHGPAEWNNFSQEDMRKCAVKLVIDVARKQSDVASGKL